MSLPECATSKLGRRYDEAEPVRASAQGAVERHQPAAEDFGERDVFGVVGPSPAELLGDLPSRSSELGLIDAADRAAIEVLVLDLSPDRR